MLTYTDAAHVIESDAMRQAHETVMLGLDPMCIDELAVAIDEEYVQRRVYPFTPTLDQVIDLATLWGCTYLSAVRDEED